MAVIISSDVLDRIDDYAVANRLLSMLERAGIVSLVTKSGARDVLVKDNSSLQSLLNSLKNKLDIH